MFTGDPIAPTPSTAYNDNTIATTAYVKSNLATFQPFDGDLTAIAATNRNEHDLLSLWYECVDAVTIGTNLTFVGGTLAATGGGGGDVFKASANAFTAQNTFAGFGLVVNHTALQNGYGLEANATPGKPNLGHIGSYNWVNDNSVNSLQIFKSRGGTVGTHVALSESDLIGRFCSLGATVQYSLIEQD